ncbi:MAG: polymer-forming cytoskeletal protein [Candidatus Omnitrophica bacterium]|nr:polymer-forming cytoskeletal protein [Candidatus Omnitrophota bacterium]MCM8799309.1 polymer-forming cytoskeletal protein [Candidatus Omnitrophota bacterium]
MPLRKKIEEKILDVDASVAGNLIFKDPVNLKINGKFEGILETKGNLTIGPKAVVNAEIKGDNIVIAGKVKGKIVAFHLLTLLPTAVVEGEIFPARLNVAEGAILEGSCKMLEDVFGLEEVARYLEVNTDQILEWANTGKIPAFKEGNEWRFERKAIDAWVASNKVK